MTFCLNLAQHTVTQRAVCYPLEPVRQKTLISLDPVTPLAQLGRGNSNSTITLAMTMVTQLSNHLSACYSTVEPRQVELKGLGHHLTTVARKSKDFMAGMQ